MKSKHLIILACIVIILGIIYAVQRKGSGSTAPSGTRELVPASFSSDGLSDIRFKGKNGVVTLKQTPSGWVVAERYNYPADVAKLREFFIKLCDARIAQELPLTAKQAEELSLTPEKAVTVTMSDRNAKPVHTFLFGSEHTRGGDAAMNNPYGGMSGNGRYIQLAMTAAKECLADSGLNREQEDLTRCGVIVSSGVGGIEMAESETLRCSEKGYDRASPFYIPTTIANMGAGYIAILSGFQGMCTCPVTACAGGSNAVGDAFRHIRDGYAEVMLCGGAEAAVTPLSMGGFTTMRALHVGDDPNRASIPFDAERNGFVMGEGAGILLLEEYEHAMARGAKVYAEVVGYGATCDAYHITAPAPNGEGGARAMAQALSDAGVSPELLG